MKRSILSFLLRDRLFPSLPILLVRSLFGAGISRICTDVLNSVKWSGFCSVSTVRRLVPLVVYSTRSLPVPGSCSPGMRAAASSCTTPPIASSRTPVRRPSGTACWPRSARACRCCSCARPARCRTSRRPCRSTGACPRPPRAWNTPG